MSWPRLRDVAGLHAPVLRAALPAGPGCCAVCRGPVPGGYRRCFQCVQHRLRAPGLLADVVAPVSYAVSGTAYARALWQYKACAGGQDRARAALRVILLVFLHDHGPCLWRRVGTTTPTHIAVVPTGRHRPGVHPLRALVEPYLTVPWATLLTGQSQPARDRDAWDRDAWDRDAWGRDARDRELRIRRFRAASPLTGATVLLLDDTWTTGASAQSAAVALKLGGAARVVTVVLGRHVNPADPHASFLTGA